MKPIKLTLLFLVIAQFSFAQYWAKSQAGANVDETLAVASDTGGNVYATGYFSTSAGINQTNLNVQGLTDIFVSKVGLDGANLWNVSFGGSQSDRGLGITVDLTGNVFVCGFYTGTINFGNDVSLTSQGGQDAFLVKLSDAGSALWARGIGSTGNSDRANAVAVDSLGNVFLTGQFSGDASTGSFSLDVTDGTIDAFIAKYDGNGNELWAKQGTAEELERGMALATDNQGAVYATGQFSGDITFDNLYENNVLNAIFLVKYTADGEEQWLRSAGGTEESIAYGITGDGSNVYVTGDFGASISILGDGLPQTIISGFSRSAFIFSFDPDGNLNWSSTAGSSSFVSSRDIDYFDGELAIAGFYRCTFESYSDEYGEATFNSMGFEDAFAARYISETGDFKWARNFGSRTDEQAYGVTILPDGLDVIAGAFTDYVIIPNSQYIGGYGVSNVSQESTTFCGDTEYAEYVKLNGTGEQDGFLIKVLSEDRLPYDYFIREEGSACDLSVLNPCIHYPWDQNISVCPDTVAVCLDDNLSLTNMMLGEGVAFDYYEVWENPNGSGSSQFTVEGEFSVTLSSNDGCYMVSDQIYAILAPGVEKALLSDNVPVNSDALITETVEACEGDTVLIWASYPDSLSGNWQIWDTDVYPGEDTLVITGSVEYTLGLENQYGCTSKNDILLDFESIAQDYSVDIYFPIESDSISVCESWASWGIEVYAFVEGTTDLYPNDPYTLDWTVTQGAQIGGSSDSYIDPVQSGWHVVTVTAGPLQNNCSTIDFSYADVDSIYIELMPNPDVYIEVTGPTTMCPGDTISVDIDYSGTLSVTTLVAENFVDSAYISQPGEYEFWVDSVGENGCQGSSSYTHVVNTISSPQIYTDPPNSVICPLDSVQILSDTEGDFLWQAPEGTVEGDNSLWVLESGLYFAEVTLYEGCVLVSNTVQLTEYATPFLFSEDGLICEGGTEEIWVISNSMETIEWLAPLSGSDSSQVVTEAGIYSVEVTGCDITTDISIEILAEEPEVEIYVVNPEPTCVGDSIFVQAVGEFDQYDWSPAGTGQGVWFGNAGSVFVWASSDDGCQAQSDSLDLSFEPLPAAPVVLFDPVCEGQPIEVTISTPNSVNVLDGAGGTVVSNDPVLTIQELWNDTIIYAYLNTEFCDGEIFGIELLPKPYPEAPVPATDAPICTGESLTLEVLNPEAGVSYYWLSPNGDITEGELTGYSISDLFQEGEYLNYADLDNCQSDSISIDVELFETMQVVLPQDTTFCFSEGFFIEADTVYATYQWSDGSTDALLYPEVSGELALTTTDFNGCESTDFITVVILDCILEMPNVLTPNGDGLNDILSFAIDPPETFEFVVFDRSGSVVYRTNNPSEEWSGESRNGDQCNDGIYFYTVRFIYADGRSVEESGNLSILRNQ